MCFEDIMHFPVVCARLRMIEPLGALIARSEPRLAVHTAKLSVKRHRARVAIHSAVIA